MVHESDHAVGRHRAGVESRRSEERGDVEGHRTLRRVEDEELAPAHPEQGHLVGDLEVGEERDVPSPLDGAEEEPGCELADVVDAHYRVGLHALGVTRRRVGLSSKQ